MLGALLLGLLLAAFKDRAAALLIGVSALQTSEYWGSGREPARLGTAHPRNAPYQGFAAADGDLTIAAGNDRLWAAVADVVGLPHLVDDPRFVTQADRVAHQGELAALRAAAEGIRTKCADLATL